MRTSFLRTPTLQTHTLHPSVEWSFVGPHKLQVRSPHGDHLTFDQDAELLGSVLQRLCEQPDLLRQFQLNAVTEEFLRLLHSRGFLVVRNQFLGDDWLAALLDFQYRRAYEVIKADSEVALRPLSVSLQGDGWVRDCAEAAMNDLRSVGILTHEASPHFLRFVCSDEEDFGLFREANREAILCGSMVSFAYRLGSRLVLGPLVVPRESSCVECYFQRLYANLTHREEFDELQRVVAARREWFRSVSTLAAPYFRYSILRYLAHIAFQLHDVVEPGVVYSCDALKTEMHRKPVMKLPRCPVCGRVRRDEPMHSVRDLA